MFGNNNTQQIKNNGTDQHKKSKQDKKNTINNRLEIHLRETGAVLMYIGCSLR